MFSIPLIVRLARRGELPQTTELIVLGWSGMRGGALLAAARRVRALRLDLIAVERSRLADLRRRGEISAESMRRIQHELDLEESRLS